MADRRWKRDLGIGLLFTPLLSLLSYVLPAKTALKLVFRVEAWLYTLEGRLAIQYNGGIHTKHRHLRYHDFFVSRIPAGAQVLDIGCGIGAVAYDIAERAGAIVTGIDISEHNVDIARERFSHPNLTYILGDALEYLPDSRFDIVILSNVLEHLPERPAFLRRVHENTKAERFLIRVPLFERDWRVPLKKELGIEWRLDGTHETEYTLESFATEMDEAKLDIVHQEVRWGGIWAEAHSR